MKLKLRCSRASLLLSFSSARRWAHYPPLQAFLAEHRKKLDLSAGPPLKIEGATTPELLGFWSDEIEAAYNRLTKLSQR
jgi:hypothetical protein